MKTMAAINKITHWNASLMHKFGFSSLRYSLSIIFVWFGILKPMGISPAEELVANTAIWFSADWFMPLLGWWEVAIGVFMLSCRTIRFALLLLFMQIPCTFLPLLLLPEVTFTHFPYGLTLEGQYIIKNLTLIAAAITVGGVVYKKRKGEEIL